MVCSRIFIKTFFDDYGKKIVEVDYNSINVTEEEKNVYKSNVSEERIKIRKKNKLFFYLTKTEKNNRICIYEKISNGDINSLEKEFFEEVIKDFSIRFFFFNKKEKLKLLYVYNGLFSQE